MRRILLSLVALIGLCSAAALGNYAMTQGAGTTFGSTVVGGIHYVQMFICDLTTPAQCATVSSGGAVKVDGSGATQPVSGTVTANLGTIGGASTAAKQPALGTAGSASADVITVQGAASMTPLFMQSATVPVSTMNNASANSGVNAAVAGVFDDASPTSITENSFGFIRMSANRNLYQTIRDAAGNERGANVDASNRLTTAPSLVSSSVAAGAYATGSIVDGAYLTDGAIADAAVSAGATGSNSAKLRAISRDLGTIATNTGAAIPTQSVGVPIGGIGLCDGANGATNPCTTLQTVLAASTAAAAANKPAVVALHPSSGTPSALSPYPFGATPYTASTTGTTAATTATLAGASSVTTYICGFSIRANATAAVTNNATVTGTITGTLNFTQWTAPNASGIGVTEIIFTPCVPASTTNTSIAVVSGAPGTAGIVSVTAWGYKL